MSKTQKITTKFAIWFLIRIFRNKSVRAAALNWMRLDLNKTITNKKGSIVRFGLFKNLQLDESSGWDESGSTLQKILGIYEQEILETLETLGNFDTFVNIGAADGYYGFGLLHANLCKNVIFFEKDQVSRDRIALRAENFQTKVQVFGEATQDTLTKVFQEKNYGRTLVLMDIEGGEFNLLNYPAIHSFMEAIIIVEIHDFLEPNFDKQELERRLDSHFKITKIYNRTRRLPDDSQLNSLHDNEKWLLISEGRITSMEWWVLRPNA